MKIHKKIIGYILALWLGLWALAPSAINTVHAEENTETTQSTIKDAMNGFWEIVDIGLKIVYVVMWPMLFLAGISLDNSMVYGSFFHMDAPLWSFWNMTKNFANFALGFILLFSILRWIFSSFGKDKKDQRSPMSVIKKTLIAGVLIQASWFLLAAIIDISTIATYAIWGLPMSLLNDKDSAGANTKIMQTESHLELNNVTKISEDDFRVWYKFKVGKDDEKPIEVSPCLIKTLGTDTYIVGRKYGDARFSNTEIDNKIGTEDMKIAGDDYPLRNICVYGNDIYFFNEFPNIVNETENYSSMLARIINEIWEYTLELEECWFIINLEDNPELWSLSCDQAITDNIKTYMEEENQWTWYLTYEEIFTTLPTNPSLWTHWWDAWSTRFASWAASTVSEIIDKSKWFVGPFVTIYASIMDFANLSDTDTNNSSLGKNTGNLMIRVGVAIGLIFPLIALTLVLFVRIGYLRVVIAASPILVLANVFKFDKKIGDYFSINNIIRAIFAPVITVFALSISLIFMTTLSHSVNENNMNKVNILNNLDIYHDTDQEANDGENTYLTIAWYTIAYPKIVDTYAGATGDWFSWMIVSFCGIGIMRFILFAAIKASGVIGKVGEKVQEFGTNVIKTTPIIPFGSDGGKVGIGTLSENLNVRNAEQIRNKSSFVNYEGQQEYLQDKMDKRSWTDRDFDKEESKTISWLLNSGNSKDIESFLTNNWFVKKWSAPEDIQEQVQAIYTNNENFKDMVMNNAGTNGSAIGEIIWEDFLKEKITDTISTSLGSSFKNKDEVDKKIAEINKQNWDLITKLDSFNKTIELTDGWSIKIEKSSDGKTLTTK